MGKMAKTLGRREEAIAWLNEASSAGTSHIDSVEFTGPHMRLRYMTVRAELAILYAVLGQRSKRSPTSSPARPTSPRPSRHPNDSFRRGDSPRSA